MSFIYGNCKCRWDGNLDGKLIRCAEHLAAYKAEREARQEAALHFERLLQQIAAEAGIKPKIAKL